MFTKLSKEIYSKHETLLFYTSFRCLLKVKMLARAYEIKNKFILFFELMQNKIFFCQSNQKSFADVGKLSGYF